VLTTSEANRIAQAQGYDLVEVSPTAKPPVCKIMDFGKYKYDLDKKKKEAKKHQVQVKVKEIKYHANVDDHDYDYKMRHALEFLEDNNRIKCSLFFRGRENAHTEIGFQLFQRIIAELKDVAKVEQAPKQNGKNLSMLLAPLKIKKPTRKKAPKVEKPKPPEGDPDAV
jgi:translation initiation factor IF-3